MTRVVIENLMAFLTPTFLYFAYILITRGLQKPTASGDGSSPDGAANPSIFEGVPYAWLFFAGAAVLLLTLAAFGSNTGGKPGQHYKPPVMKDGRIEPGRME